MKGKTIKVKKRRSRGDLETARRQAIAQWARARRIRRRIDIAGVVLLCVLCALIGYAANA